MTQGHPVVERYLTHFEVSINQFDFPERDEITNEIRNHIAEAHAAGTELDVVLKTLGPADVLARAYAVELTLNPDPPRRGRTFGRFLSTLVAAGMRPVWALSRLLTAVFAFGMRSVRAVSSLLRAVAASGLRLVWTVGRFLRTVAAVGMRPVWALGRFVRAVAAAAMRRVWAIGRFSTAVVAAGPRRVRTLGGFLKVAAGCVAALFVGTAIAAIGIGFTLFGLYLLVGGILETAFMHDGQFNDLPPAVAMTLGPVLMAAGGAALLLLRLYLPFMVAALQKTFPATRGAALLRAFSS